MWWNHVNQGLRHIFFLRSYVHIFVKEEKWSAAPRSHRLHCQNGQFDVFSSHHWAIHRYVIGIAKSPSHPIVCGFRRSKRAGPIPISKAITYSTVRDMIKSLGTHSLHAGGAPAAAAANVSERCLTRQGGWKSAFSKDMYIKDSIDNKLSVTRAMKLWMYYHWDNTNFVHFPQ